MTITKKEQVFQYYSNTDDVGRQKNIFVEYCIKKFGMTKLGAQTYFYICKKMFDTLDIRPKKDKEKTSHLKFDIDVEHVNSWLVYITVTCNGKQALTSTIPQKINLAVEDLKSRLSHF